MNAKLKKNEAESDAEVADPERMLMCAACEAPVARVADRTERDGAHVHRATNPAGVEYEIGCFSDAPGAVSRGEVTTYFSWFPGYGWRISTCRKCDVHLGWEFSGTHPFFGLILNRLKGP